MKKIFKLFILIIVAISIPVTAAFSQDKKTENKIKVIIDDGSGAKVLMDTLITTGSMPDSIKLDDGKVVYFEKGSIKAGSLNKPGKMTVMYTTSGDNEKKEENTVIVTSDDLAADKISEVEGGKHIYAYSTARKDGDKVIIIKDNDGVDRKIVSRSGVEINSGDNETETEMTKYVVARDGVVVTIESNDEARAKELMKVIEGNLGTGKGKGDAGKTLAGKTNKK